MVSLFQQGGEFMTKKQKWNQDQYIKHLVDGKKAYEERKKFLKEFSLSKKAESTKGESNSSDSSATSYGKSGYTINGKTPSELAKLSLKGSSGLTADELNAWLNPRTKDKVCNNCGQRSHMYNTGAWFIEAEKQAGYRADAIAAHAAEESGWGTSSIACKKKNFFGYGAVDSDPYNGAYKWDTHKDGFISAAKLISHGYIYRSKYYKGQKDQDSYWLMNNPPSVNKGHRYASNNLWVNNICTIWSNAPQPKNGSSDKSAKAKSILTFGKNVGEGEKGYSVINQGPTAEEKEYLFALKYAYKVPLGDIRGNYFNAPKYQRKNYVADLKQSQSFVEKIGYTPLPNNRFIHLGGPEENYYSEKARDVFMLLQNKLGYKQMIVSRGYDPDPNNLTSHSVGIAIDIHASSAIEAVRIADTAWLLGIRSISIGPKFVHVDIGPESVWGYDNMPIYRGPGSVKVGDFRYGF